MKLLPIKPKFHFFRGIFRLPKIDRSEKAEPKPETSTRNGNAWRKQPMEA